jgi:hypothetical protein
VIHWGEGVNREGDLLGRGGLVKRMAYLREGVRLIERVIYWR